MSWLASAQKTHTRRWAARFMMAVSTAILTTFVVDRMLGTFGFPPEIPEVVSHPSQMQQQRDQLEFRYLFQTNDFGLRDRNIPLMKAAGRRRVFVAGDSFTEGDGVESSERFTELLQVSFQDDGKDIDFINGGLSGAGPLEYGNLFVKVGLLFQPDALLICFFVNDVSNTAEQLFRTPFMLDPPRARSKPRRILHRLWPRINTQVELLQSDAEQSKRTQTDDFLGSIAAVARARGVNEGAIQEWILSVPSELGAAVNEGRFNGAVLSQGLLNPSYWTDSLDINTPSAKRRWTTVCRILSELVHRCRHSGVEVAIVLLPTQFQYDPESHTDQNPWVVTGCHIRREWLIQETEIQKQLAEWATSGGVPILDLTETFRDAARNSVRLHWSFDGHWNAFGQQTAARAIDLWLRTNEVFKTITAPRKSAPNMAP
ncbi:MAG: SGNH/GDSL hydrolase family protein [Planctomycetota bacterium]|nr:MAG: SGNH/GDSL hydrolase family protein [Planctomycetota bacterium]